MLNIRGLSLGNFRVFAEPVNLRLAPVTVFTGPNSTGKSTSACSLSIMKNLDTTRLPFRVRFDSGKDPAGSFEMIRNYRSHDERVTVGYELYNILLGENVNVDFTLQRESDFDAVVRRIKISSKSGSIFDFGFDKESLSMKMGVGYLLEKLKKVASDRKRFMEMERSFREIRSTSGCYKESPRENDRTRVRIFRVDNVLKRKNLEEYLQKNNVSQEEYERLFYYFGKSGQLNGTTAAEAELMRKTGRIMNDFDANEILFNNALLVKILEIPACELTEAKLLEVIKKEYPELYDCLALLANHALLEQIVELLRRKSYREWEDEFVNSTVTSSKRVAGTLMPADINRVIEHQFQSRFDKSDFLLAFTELSMAREGFLQAYDRYSNLKALSMFCGLVFDKIIHDVKSDLEHSSSVRVKDAVPGLNIGFDHPLHSMMRDYSKICRKDTFLKKWIRKFGICDDFSVDAPMKGMGYFPGIKRNNETYPLLGEGMGTNRLIMMLLSISNARKTCALRDFNEEVRQYPQTIFIEEPEMGMHPSWQSKIADMIAEARKEKGLHFIIETHSDHIINKLRYLVASGNLDSSDVVIQYFDRGCKPGSPGTTEIRISDNGDLSTDIPTGFSDNTDLETLGMFSLRKMGKN